MKYSELAAKVEKAVAEVFNNQATNGQKAEKVTITLRGSDVDGNFTGETRSQTHTKDANGALIDAAAIGTEVSKNVEQMEAANAYERIVITVSVSTELATDLVSDKYETIFGGDGAAKIFTADA